MPDALPTENSTLNDALDASLRDGLRRLPSPPVSADFDARVLAMLAQPPPLAERVRMALHSLVRTGAASLRPLLGGMACALPLTLLALFWTLHAPASDVPPPLATNAAAPAASRPLDMAAVDALLSRPDLRASSLQAWAHAASIPAPAESPPPPPPDGSEPRRRREGRRASCAHPALLTV